MRRGLPLVLVATLLVALVFVIAPWALDVPMGSMLIGSLRSALGSPITWCVLLLLGLAVGLGRRVMGRAARSRGALEGACAALEALVKDGEGLGGGERIVAVSEALEAAPQARELWEAFAAQVIEHRGAARHCGDAAQVFDEARYLEALGCTTGGVTLRFPFLSGLPGLMTGLGMLGTFGGIALGLGELGGASAAPDDVMTSIGGVVIGLASAFWTSIFGLLLALWCALRVGYEETAQLVALARLRGGLERLFPAVTAERLLRDQGEALRDACSGQRDAHHAQVTLLERLARNTGDETAQRLDAILGGQHLQVTLIEQVIERLGGGASGPVEALVELGQQQLTLLRAMHEESEESRSQLQTIAGDLADSLGRQLHDSFTQELGPRLARLTDALEAQNSEAQRDTLERAQRFTEALVKQLDGALRDNLDGLSTSVMQFALSFDATSQGMNEIMASMGEALEAQRSLVSESARAAEQLGQQSQAIYDAWTSREADLLGRYHEAAAVFATTFERASGIAERLCALSEHFEQARETSQRLLLAADEVQRTATSSAGVLERSIQGSAALLDESARSLETISAQTTGWVERTSGAIERFGAGLSASIDGSLGAYDATLTTAVRSLSTAISELEDAAYAMAERAPRDPSALSSTGLAAVTPPGASRSRRAARG